MHMSSTSGIKSTEMARCRITRFISWKAKHSIEEPELEVNRSVPENIQVSIGRLYRDERHFCTSMAESMGHDQDPSERYQRRPMMV